jgi:hypothetical protein
VRAGEDNNTPVPEENEVVIFRSFFKAGLRFPLSRFVVEVLKTFRIFLHQLTPEAILRMGVTPGFRRQTECKLCTCQDQQFTYTAVT